MKSVILVVTAVHVLAHGVFGCCGHVVLASPAAEEHCVCRHSNSHHADRPHAADWLQGDHHHGTPLSEDWTDEEVPSRLPHECVHASCHWMTGEMATSSAEMDGWMPLATVAVLPVDPISLVVTGSSHFMAPVSAAAPPLRLHLEFGVMLI